MGQDIALEGVVEGLARIPQRISAGPTKRDVEPRKRARRRRGDLAEVQAQHRRRQHRAGKPTLAQRQRQQRETAAHRMTHREPGFRQAGVIAVQQAAEILEKRLVAPGMALQAVGKLARRQSLTAPVMRQHHEAARHEVLDRLVIFLDRFCTPAGQHHRTAQAAGGREQRSAQARTAGAIDPGGLTASRSRSFGYVEQRCGFVAHAVVAVSKSDWILGRRA